MLGPACLPTLSEKPKYTNEIVLAFKSKRRQTMTTFGESQLNVLIEEFAKVVGAVTPQLERFVQQFQQESEPVLLFRLEVDELLVARNGKQGICAVKMKA